ncbi:regulatory YrvL family protein [Heyndrickxia sporothermodurans]|uniref:Regulatory protein YrvL n=2 Tax=Heyndrickxia TaxID=2837504 RepID=A0AB37HHB8_9BACI|nr:MULTISPECIES: YrvL family regulatory protein [Heyndrickxia]MBL5768751.1 hypothetical protein [Heyndrickxia sporothermodurans]MBL5772338.1 hypothetical protein [Heyndrickxia sporothermodurans]MBL5775869.1 hypothetical protein [Heyndrickxia sporothermodurans]MBL5779411.1 hypothetical protein [Heyndrickxia sporothermodurans]MBL5782993.1 hypothetical protein [Heyndrickxia sporothermodurans]
MKNNDEKFSDLNFPSKLVTILSIGFLIIFALVVVIALYFFGIIGFFRLLNVQYDSNQALISFILKFFFICLIAEVFAKLIIRFIISYVNSNIVNFIVLMFFDILISWIVLHYVDESMSSITIPTWVELILALFLACAEYNFDKKKE